MLGMITQAGLGSFGYLLNMPQGSMIRVGDYAAMQNAQAYCGEGLQNTPNAAYNNLLGIGQLNAFANAYPAAKNKRGQTYAEWLGDGKVVKAWPQPAGFRFPRGSRRIGMLMLPSGAGWGLCDV